MTEIYVNCIKLAYSIWDAMSESERAAANDQFADYLRGLASAINRAEKAERERDEARQERDRLQERLQTGSPSGDRIDHLEREVRDLKKVAARADKLHELLVKTEQREIL